MGSFTLCMGGRGLTEIGSRKALALLAYLAMNPKPVSRDLLAALLWPEMTNAAARNNLRSTLAILRTQLGSYLQADVSSVTFNRHLPHRLDVEIMGTRLDAAMATQDIGELQAAVALYQGEFLQGFHVRGAEPFEEWMLQRREQLHVCVLQALETLAELCLEQGEYETGLGASRRLLTMEPWLEAAHRLQMQLLAASGRRTAALMQYEKCQEILASEFGVEPDLATTALYEEIRQEEKARAGPQESFPVPAPAPVAPPIYAGPIFYHNLPRRLTRFIGRNADITHIRNLLLSPDCCLVTLAGQGGIGKTRLALAVAQSFVDEIQASLEHPPAASGGEESRPQTLFADGVVFASLAALTTTEMRTDQLVTAVAQALGLQPGGKEPLLQQLQEYLADKALLLLLDNVEPFLPEAADFLVALLQRAPKLKILVTSRHLLNLQAEVAVRLHGLPTPPLEDETALTVEEMLTYSSVALFVERAQRVNLTFQIDAANRAAIAQICRLVGGLPLAIELAANQARYYACPKILAQVQESYRALSSTLRDLAPRHRSIRAVLDYSWQFLDPDAARLLAACSIFPGSFDGAAVAAITGATEEALFLLADQSLIQLLPAEKDARSSRFGLHDLVRQYSAEQLHAQPDAEHGLRTAHCRYYLSLLIEQSQHFVHDMAALGQMQRELHNLRAAWEWAGAQGERALLAAGAYPLRQFYELLSLYHEAERTFARAIAQIQHAQDQSADAAGTRVRAQLLCQQVHFCERLVQTAQAEALAREAIALGAALDDHAIQAHTYRSLCVVYGHQADYARAQHAAAEALVHARAAGLPLVEAQSLQNIGCTYLYRDDTEQALDYLHQCLAHYRAATARGMVRDHHAEGLIYLDLGIAYQAAGDLLQARAYYQRSYEAYERLPSPVVGAYALARLSELHLRLGNFAQAAADAQKALKINQSMGSRLAECTALARLVHVHCRLEEWPEADRLCQMLLKRMEPLEAVIVRPFAYFLQGEVRRAQDAHQAALAAYGAARREYLATEQMAQAISAQARMAQIRHEMGDLPGALTLIAEILPHLSQTVQSSWAETTADYLIAYQILAAADDPRAPAILERGHAHLKAAAGTITDEDLRHAYLTNVAANQTLAELAAARLHLSRAQRRSDGQR